MVTNAIAIHRDQLALFDDADGARVDDASPPSHPASPTRMDTNELHARMWVDLWMRESDRLRAEFAVIEAALLYLEVGLPLASVLDALKLTELEWHARVARHADRRADNRAAAERFRPPPPPSDSGGDTPA